MEESRGVPQLVSNVSGNQTDTSKEIQSGIPESKASPLKSKCVCCERSLDMTQERYERCGNYCTRCSVRAEDKANRGGEKRDYRKDYLKRSK